MPRCSLCGQSAAQKSDLTLVRTAEGRWVAQCAACIAAAPPVLAANAPTQILSAPARAGADPVGRIRATLAWLEEQDPSATLRRLYDRAHERFQADLAVRFALQRDDVFCIGMVRDISRGGIGIVTEKTLQSGQIVRFEMPAPGAPVTRLLELLQPAGEVRRVQRLDNGLWEVGVRFVKRAVASEQNRRRHKRIPVDLIAWCRRDGCAWTEECRVLDLSQGGLRLRFDAPIAQGEAFELIVRGETGSFARADLCGRAEVMRVSTCRHGEWAAGCRFLHMVTRPRPVAAETAK